MKNTVFGHLVDAITAVNKDYKATLPGEKEIDSIKRLVIATDVITEPVWLALPKETQEWANTAAKAINAMQTPAPCPGYQVELPPTATATTVDTAAAPVPHVIPIPDGTVTGSTATAAETAAGPAAPVAKVKKERKPREPKAPKVEKPKLNLVQNVQMYCLQHPDAKVDEIEKGLAAVGITPTKATIVIQSTAVRNVRRAAEAVGMVIVLKTAAAA